MQVTETPNTNCVECGTEMTGASSVMEDARPEAGDISICLYCGHLAVFAEDLSLRELTKAEMFEIAGDKELIAILNARAEFMAGKKVESSND